MVWCGVVWAVALYVQNKLGRILSGLHWSVLVLNSSVGCWVLVVRERTSVSKKSSFLLLIETVQSTQAHRAQYTLNTD